ncbi:hypothetical protein D3C81_1023720 [compost metagenome]
MTQGVEQGADADPAVFIAAVAGQLLQQQACGMFAVAGQQQAGGELLGMTEIVLEGFVQAVAGQVDQALVALRFARVQAGVFDGDGQQGAFTQCLQ